MTGGLASVVAVLALIALLGLWTRPASAAPPSATLKANWGGGFDDAELLGVEETSQTEHGVGPGLVLTKAASGRYLSSGTVISRPIQAAFPFNNVVMSWNIVAPHGTGAIIEVRAGSGTDWTEWYHVARWGKLSSPAGPIYRKDENGRVAQDTLELSFKAAELQYRVTLVAENPTQTPVLKMVAACCADTDSEAIPAVALPQDISSAPWARDLPVPFRSQRSEAPAIAGRICSPTCIAMVMQYYGVSIPTELAAKEAYDPLSDIYGNWPFNTAVAGQYGFEAYVTRLSGLEPIQDEIAGGHPVIISIRFGPGTLRGGPLNSSSGHLIVVRGFTEEGDVVANDPAGRTEAEGRVVYRREELLRAWRSGIAYIIRPGTVGPSRALPADGARTNG